MVLSLCALVLCSVTAWLGIRSLYYRQRCLRRIVESVRVAEGADVLPRERRAWLRRWLALAGFRQQSATALFVAAFTACGIMGGLIAWGLIYVDTTSSGGTAAHAGAGGGHIGFGTWLLAGMFGFACASLPFVFVSMRRQRRMAEVRQDLPLFLDLLATLAEAGMSFDVALAKILHTHRSRRTLSVECELFQREISLGISRRTCFRRLSQRLAVPAASLFISALMQCEQLGANVTHTLRRQADDLRRRRREAAMLHAQGLSVKLVFPVVLCFLPGIFLVTLGPTIYRLSLVVGDLLTS